MKRTLVRTTSVVILVITFLCLAPAMHAQQIASPPRMRLGQNSSRASRLLGERTQPATVPAMASPEIIWVQCPAEATGLGPAVTCGYLPVPLAREHPRGVAQIEIYFELYLHTNPGPAESAIFINPGGPGLTTTGLRSLLEPLYSASLDVHDFVLFDDRGRGSSAAIDCSDLQHGAAPFDTAVAECAAQLGASANAYGTGAIADDAEALRAALRYNKIDYLGGSYGGEDATAYATRYGFHLRSILLDAPAGSPYLPAFAADRGSTSSIPRAIELGCQRSPTCRVDHPDPDSELSALIQAIHDFPLNGTGNNASGVPTPVTMDEGSLAALLTAGTGPPFGPPGSGGFVDDNEVLAAARAYAQGDSVPLLRIGAEGIIPLSIDNGDPTFFSEGDFLATLCIDMIEPYSWHNSMSMRAAQLNDAISDLPPGYFSPFTNDVARYPIFAFEGQCLNWQRPTRPDPVLPRTPAFPDVPVLVLHGDMDAQISTEQVQAITEQFPHGKLIQVASSGHVTSGFGECGTNISNHFLETLEPGDTSCAQTSETVWPAVGRFPLLAIDALPATPAAGNHGTIHDLKVVSVAVATMRDTLQRTTLGSTGGVGLRGGTWTDTVGATSQVITLSGCLFSEDISISGTITYGFDTSVSASLSVTRLGEVLGTLNVTGFFLHTGPVGNFSVTGSIGGRQIAALVPEA
jgi:pimeloyl-ACP methyl ester carboxylesterase